MQEREERREQWNQFRLNPAPPKLPLQECIDRYLETGDETYLSWFLHWHEPAINRRIEYVIGTYAMEAHFDGLKGAYLLGLTLALQNYEKSRGASFLTFKEFYINTALHDYIRTMRTGYTIQSRDEDAMLRKAMAIYAEHDYRTDDETIGIIARELNRKQETVRELLQGGLRNMGCVDFYRQYSDADGEEAAEEAYGTTSTDPYHMLVNANMYLSHFPGE